MNRCKKSKPLEVFQRLVSTEIYNEKSVEPLVNFLGMAGFDAFAAVGPAQVQQDRFIG